MSFFQRINPLKRGKSGEDQARAYLKDKGYRFQQANYRTKMGELDLVMWDGDTLVFVEVKARGRTDFGRPEEFVGPRKQGRLAKAALQFMKEFRFFNRPARFDVVAIGPEGVEHIPNAFELPAGAYTL